MRPGRMSALLVVCLAAGLLGLGPAVAQECVPRLLVLSAYPGEIDKLLTTAEITGAEDVDGRRFHVGTLAGHEVALGLTGIGLVQATSTTQAALDHFRCGPSPAITGIAFSGVAGGPYIGDVVVPERWTDDDGQTWQAVDERMMAVAAEVAAGGTVELTREVAAGDPLCAGADPETVETITLEHEPEVRIGGQGRSSDPFDGREFPCFPGGGDVFGCEPCRADPQVPDLAGLPEQIAPFVDPGFFFGYFEAPPDHDEQWDVVDMESGAMARVAAAHGIPFIVFRGVSDGQGDPLMLPGFPFQFFYYRQIAAENAARVTLAFLEAWPGAATPVTSEPAPPAATPPPAAAPGQLPATGGGAAAGLLVLLSLAVLGGPNRRRGRWRWVRGRAGRSVR